MQDEYIDTRKPLHAKAYLAAASHILSGWPQEWSAGTLEMALLTGDEDILAKKEMKEKIRLWNPIKAISASDDTDPYFKSDEMICDLAESFIDFLEENK